MAAQSKMPNCSCCSWVFPEPVFKDLNGIEVCEACYQSETTGALIKALRERQCRSCGRIWMRPLPGNLCGPCGGSGMRPTGLQPSQNSVQPPAPSQPPPNGSSARPTTDDPYAIAQSITSRYAVHRSGFGPAKAAPTLPSRAPVSADLLDTLNRRTASHMSRVHEKVAKSNGATDPFIVLVGLRYTGAGPAQPPLPPAGFLTTSPVGQAFSWDDHLGDVLYTLSCGHSAWKPRWSEWPALPIDFLSDLTFVLKHSGIAITSDAFEEYHGGNGWTLRKLFHELDLPNNRNRLASSAELNAKKLHIVANIDGAAILNRYKDTVERNTTMISRLSVQDSDDESSSSARGKRPRSNNVSNPQDIASPPRKRPSKGKLRAQNVSSDEEEELPASVVAPAWRAIDFEVEFIHAQGQTFATRGHGEIYSGRISAEPINKSGHTKDVYQLNMPDGAQLEFQGPVMTGPWPAAGADRQPLSVAGRTKISRPETATAVHSRNRRSRSSDRSP
ncbi:hypothetical protein SISSUDRAFT_1060367 [Sistotremastrum suecicum HHB10207 ss-3]|uniref:Uncharacterized protein n=1 Tax=Sistotremastrum suecicum HHB10207 ss-3 TaxID=1314776 RepID=A0A166F581_9AGAM|nr:hypothetical protein SISSUDRAFT_1060367 [Sistotremastrum suecicum HHB10207 ss-3]